MTDEPSEQNATGGEPGGTEQPTQTATESQVETSNVEVESEAPEVKSERGQQRVQQLANKAKEAETTAHKVSRENDSLKAELGKLTQPQQNHSIGGPLPFMPQSNQRPSLGEEVTQEQYWNHIEQEAAKQADTIVDLKLRQYEQNQAIRENYNNDIQELESQYAEVFESNDPELKSEFKNAFDIYQKALRGDPNVRFRDIAGPVLRSRSLGEEAGRSKAIEALSQQASESAIKPSTEKQDSQTTEEQIIAKMKSGELSAKEASKLIADLQ